MSDRIAQFEEKRFFLAIYKNFNIKTNRANFKKTECIVKTFFNSKQLFSMQIASGANFVFVFLCSVFRAAISIQSAIISPLPKQQNPTCRVSYRPEYITQSNFLYIEMDPLIYRSIFYALLPAICSANLSVEVYGKNVIEPYRLPILS